MGTTLEDDGYPPEFKGEGEKNPWNSDDFVVKNNNCYDYAFNQREPKPKTKEELEALKKKMGDQKSVPGKKAGAAAQKPYTCDNVSKGAMADNPNLIQEAAKDKKC